MSKRSTNRDDDVTENGLHPLVEAEILRRINTPTEQWIHGTLEDLCEAAERERLAEATPTPFDEHGQVPAPTAAERDQE